MLFLFFLAPLPYLQLSVICWSILISSIQSEFGLYSAPGVSSIPCIQFKWWGRREVFPVLFCLHFSILFCVAAKIASKLQTKNQQSEVHLEIAENCSNMGSSTACVCSSSWEICMNHWTEPPGDPSIKGHLENFEFKGGKKHVQN